MKPHIEEARRALRLADRDIKAFTVLAASPGVHLAVACFHAQQAVEKSLKAVLYAHRTEFRRIHNLVELALLLRQCGMAQPLSQSQLLQLTPFAVMFRYDEVEMPSLDVDEVAKRVADARTWAEARVQELEDAEPEEPESV